MVVSTLSDSGSEAELMQRYHIRHITVDRFDYGPYRYDSLANAIAQAKRDAEKRVRSQF